MAARFVIFSVEKLQQALDDYRFFYDQEMSSYCWLHNLLQKRLHLISSLDDLGVELHRDFAGKDIRDILLEINEQLFTLSEAHFQRYFESYK